MQIMRCEPRGSLPAAEKIPLFEPKSKRAKPLPLSYFRAVGKTINVIVQWLRRSWFMKVKPWLGEALQAMEIVRR